MDKEGRKLGQQTEKVDEHWKRLETLAKGFTKREIAKITGSMKRRVASLKQTKGREVLQD